MASIANSGDRFRIGRVFNDSFAVAFVKTVIRYDFMTVLHQLFGDYAADITGAPGYQNLHDL